MNSPGLKLDGATQSVPGPKDAPPKKSRFKRPSWATAVKQAPVPAQDTEEDTFNRSKETLAQFKRQQAEDEAARVKARVAEKTRKLELDKNEKARQDVADRKPTKKRKLNSQSPGSESSASDQEYASADEKVTKRQITHSRSRSSSHDELYAKTVKTVSPAKEKRATVIIDLGDDSEDDKEEQTTEGSHPTNGPKLGSMPREDPSHHPDMDVKQDSQSSSHIPTPRATISPTPAAEPPKPDPVLTIMIYSRIPGTKPLLAKRNLTQRVKEVLDAWLARQLDLTEAQKAEVFLTWRGGRVYAISSCKSLGIEVNEAGEVFFKGKSKMEAPSEENAQIAFEAVTQAILDKDKREKEAERKKLQGGGFEETPKGDPAKDKNKIKIVLKAKGHADFKLMVNPVSSSYDLYGGCLLISAYRTRSSCKSQMFAEPSSRWTRARTCSVYLMETTWSQRAMCKVWSSSRRSRLRW